MKKALILVMLIALAGCGSLPERKPEYDFIEKQEGDIPFTWSIMCCGHSLGKRDMSIQIVDSYDEFINRYQKGDYYDQDDCKWLRAQYKKSFFDDNYIVRVPITTYFGGTYYQPERLTPGGIIVFADVIYADSAGTLNESDYEILLAISRDFRPEEFILEFEEVIIPFETWSENVSIVRQMVIH